MGEVVKEKEKFLLTVVLCLLMFFSFAQTVNERPTVTMKEYVDMQIQMLERMNLLRDEHQREVSRIKDENIKVAYATQDKRLDGMNEFRQTLSDSNKTYITKSELFAWIMALLMAFFGYANYMRNRPGQQVGSGSAGSSKNIRSGDTVEVNK